MKNKQYSRIERKFNRNRKRLIVLAVVILWLPSVSPVSGGTDWFLKVTAQMIPLLTYEKQYGNPDINYAANYQVPEWFYEDENEKSIGRDSVMEELEIQDSQETQSAMLTEGANGTTYTRKQLKKPAFLLSKIFAVDSNTYMTKEELDITNLLDTDLSIEGLKGKTKGADGKKNYKILIYHTHGSESFIDSRAGVEEDTIIGAGSYLTQLLEEEYGIPVYHDKTAYDMVDGVLDRSKAYDNAYASVTKILEENPSIEVVIDLHRDGVNEDVHLVTEIGGKKTAKIMFLNGVSRSSTNGDIDYLKNPNKLKNLAFSFQMYLAGKEDYGDYVRKIYVRSYRYNLHLLPRTALIEAGAQTNTVEEEKNAMEPLAAILDKVLSKEE